jgi:hypothetical protein
MVELTDTLSALAIMDVWNPELSPMSAHDRPAKPGVSKKSLSGALGRGTRLARYASWEKLILLKSNVLLLARLSVRERL